MGRAVFAIAAALTLLFAGQAGAASIAVDTNADVSVDNNDCSLREALRSANENTNAHEPNCTAGTPAQDILNLPAGTYPLVGTPGEDLNVTGDLDYTGGGQLAIQGAANAQGVPLVTIDAPPSDRIIDVPVTGVSNHQLFVNSITLTDGRALGLGADGDGGAIRIADINVDFGIFTTRITGGQAGRNGGAVSFDTANAFGNLVVEDSELSGNSAGALVAGGSGGAIWSGVAANEPIVSRSTMAANSADGVGGAIALKASEIPTITLRNSTLSANSANAGGSAVGFFGTTNNPSAFLEFSTVAGNTSPFAHAAIESAGASQAVFLRGSIIAGNTGAGGPSNCAGPGPFNSDGYNVESADTCFLVPALPDLINTDPLLAPLGISTVTGATQTTRTHGLFDGSPAANFVPRTPVDRCEIDVTDGLDQRGLPRPDAPGLCDAGAFEGTVGPKPTPPVGNPTLPPTTPKKCKKGQKLKKGKCVKKRKKRKRR